METVSQEIFNIIKGANYDVVLFTEGGEKTLDADTATRFYVSEHDMMISVRSENNKLELVVQLGADFDINANKTLLDSFKSAVHKQMGEYTVKRFDKNIEPKDFSHQSVTEENTEINRLRELSGITHESYSDDFQYAEDEDNLIVSKCCGADAYIRHNEIKVGDEARCSECRKQAEFVPASYFTEEDVSEEEVTVDNAGNIAGYLDTIDDYAEQVSMIDDQTDPRDVKEMAHRIQNAADDIRTRELKLTPSNIRQQFESDFEPSNDEVAEGSFWGRDDMVKKMKDDEKARGMKRFRKTEDGATHGHSTSDPKEWKKLIANGYEEVTEDYDLTEGFSKAFGSIKTSYIQLENARLIVKHSKGVNEEKRGARSRNIHSMFIENADKEQTRFPYKYMAGAKAMAMHVNNSGTFDDSKGAGIMNMCKEAMEMSQFLTHVRTNKLVNEGNANVVETIKSQLKQIKETIRGLQTVRGYNNFESKEIITNEENSVDISDKFLYNTFETVDMDAVLSTVSRIFNEREGKDTMHDKLLNDVLAVIKSGDDLKLNVDVNDPTNPNNEDPVKFSGGMGPLAKLSAMLSYIGMTTKNDILFNLLTQMSNDVHDMGTNNTMLAAKIANYLYKKGSAKTMEVAVATEESITDSVISELRKRIS